MSLSLQRLSLVFSVLLTVATSTALAQDDAALDDLSEATRLKISAENIEDLNSVIEKVDAALEKGLDGENAAYARQMLVSTLMQRAMTYSDAITRAAAQDQRGLVTMQLRQRGINDLQRAIDIDKQAWEAYLLMGRLHANPLGDADAARRAFTTVVDAEDAPAENRAEALALRSAVQRDPERRAADLNHAIELQPAKPDYYRLRAEMNYGQKSFDEALADIDRAIESDDEHVQSHELRGMILLGLKRYDDALASFNRASELAPESLTPFQRRSQLFQEQDDLPQAVEQLTKALELSPRDIATLLLRAAVYYQMKEMEKALADVDEAIRIEPRIPQSHLMRAEIYAADGRIDQAIAVLEQLTQMAPGQPLLLNQLGNYYLIAGKPRQAIDVLSQAYRVDPDRMNTLQLRGNAYLNVGEHAAAIADFNRAEQLDEEDSDGLLNNFAWVLATSPIDELRDGKRAVELATRACEMTGYETPHILSTLAAACAETGDFTSAIKWSEKAVEVSQQEIDQAATDKEKERLKKEQEQLAQEVASYQAKKPWRERQTDEESDAVLPTDGKEPESAAKSAAARNIEF
jgi:tetratricopeptide (TPR) repeat protein